LEQAGDAERGRLLFHEQASVTCRNCHRVGASGKQVGPELTGIGKKYDRRQLLESLLEPSRRIDPAFVTYVVQTDDGRSLTGVVVERTDEHLTLRDAQDQVVTIPLASVEEQTQQLQSLMPEGLLRDLTAQQAADLLEYLTTLQ
jgi:putative heme-binding domain-containing protein